MKNKRKRIVSLLIAVVFCVTAFAVIGASADKTYAEDGDSLVRQTVEMFYYPKWKVGNTEWLADQPDVEINMDTVQSTNLDVAKVLFNPYTGEYGCYLVKTKKAGKATLTFDAKAQGTDTWVPTTVQVTVRKWVKPCATLKVGSKSYAKKFTNKRYFSTTKKVSGKVYVKARKGWEIDTIAKIVAKTYTQVTVKNKHKVTLAKRDSLMVTFKKKGTDIYETIDLNRN
ncbi:MAG: hypothetical protein IJI74_06620 [Firmicutes bacterium]|nr:hypothetical protein [Bacillota bacterium]